MTWLLLVVVLGAFVVAVELLRRQIKADREFMEWLEKNSRG
jgi:hypothetical protein